MTKAIFDEVCGVLSGLPSQERWNKADSPKGYYFVMEAWDDALALAALIEAIKTEKFRPTPHDMYRCMVNVLTHGGGTVSPGAIATALAYVVSVCDPGDDKAADSRLREMVMREEAHPVCVAAVPMLGGWRVIGNSRGLLASVNVMMGEIMRAYSESVEQYASNPPHWPKILESAARVERITGKPWVCRQIDARPVAMIEGGG